MVTDIEHISCTSWPIVCLLLRNIYSGLLPIFKLVFFWCFSFLLFLWNPVKALRHTVQTWKISHEEFYFSFLLLLFLNYI
jgi:hypothetical protein